MVGVGEVAQPGGVVAQSLAQRAGDVTCLLVKRGGAATAAGGVLIGAGDVRAPADPGHETGSGVNKEKDPVETKLHTAVCSGKVTIAAAQQAIVIDWTTALSKLGLR